MTPRLSILLGYLRHLWGIFYFFIFFNFFNFQYSHMMDLFIFRVRVQAVNSVGVGCFSAPHKVHTRSLPPPPPTIELLKASYNWLKISWGDKKQNYLSPEPLTFCLQMEFPNPHTNTKEWVLPLWDFFFFFFFFFAKIFLRIFLYFFLFLFFFANFFFFANCFAKILLVSNEKETNYQFGVAVMALHFQN